MFFEREANVLRISAIINLALGFVGCNAVQRTYFMGTSNEVPQSQPIDWGSFSMKITQCTWQGSRLLVALSWTNNGDSPGAPSQVPLFQLYSSDGKRFDVDDGAFSVDIMSKNLNPGMSMNGSVTFSAPRGDYKLYVENSGPRQYWGEVPASGPVVYIWDITPS